MKFSRKKDVILKQGRGGGSRENEFSGKNNGLTKRFR